MVLNLENTKDYPTSDALREKLLSNAQECVMRDNLSVKIAEAASQNP